MTTPSTIDNGGDPGESGVTTALVEVVDVSKRFGATQALDRVSLEVRRGESHALVGRNGAGKSTLVSLLTGLQVPDRGEVRFDGLPAPAVGRREAWQALVACVYQRAMIVPTLTVAENLFLNRADGWRGRTVSWRRMLAASREVLEHWEIDVEPEREAHSLDPAQRQLVEIARALAGGSRFIILDEPTAQLEGRAIERLFEHIRSMQAAGITFLYISHHLGEIYDLCQRVSVLRDGTHVATATVEAMPQGRLVETMVGGEPSGAERESGPAPRVARAAVDEAFAVDGLTRAPAYVDVSFSLGRGEIVGLAGLAGSGKLQVAETIAGLQSPGAGAITVDGRPLAPSGVAGAMRAGVGFVPEDRHRSGFVPGLSVQENLTLAIADRLGRWGFVSHRRQQQRAVELIDSLELVASSPLQHVDELSGGNQQKCVLGRALALEPKLLVLCHPTAGVDIASKEALFAAVVRCAGAGAAVLLVSDELDELRTCDRILVMFAGRVTDELPAGWRDEDLVAAMEGIHA